MRQGGVLQAAGEAARAIETVSWVLIAGGFAIFAGVMLLLAWALRGRPRAVSARVWLLGGGVLFPGAVLVVLYAWIAAVSPAWKGAPPPGALVIGVTGHMWWWEVRYRDPAGGGGILSANEIRIPTGRPVYLALASADVIHSFWVPQLAGKMDMVPGRLQHLLLSADRPGTYRGPCAEFCGEQHARMVLHVVAMEPAAFDAWLAAQALPARAPETATQARGREAFRAHRCDACHAVREEGAAAGPVGSGGRPAGPDLTHVGSRTMLGADTVPNTPQGRVDWIAYVQQHKPGARMPSYAQLDGETLAAIADWLGALR